MVLDTIGGRRYGSAVDAQPTQESTGGALFVTRHFVRAMRPVQWVKNVFVFAPLVFGMQLTHGSIALAASITFAFFCLISSAVYFVNDLVDRELDARHPTKRFRPIASGALPAEVARAGAGLLCFGALAGAALLDWRVSVVLGAYFLLNVAYSLRLKQWPYIDITCIALGFLMRVAAGGLATNIPVSGWLLLCTFLLASLLGLGKRKHELLAVHRDGPQESTRSVLEHYRVAHIDWVMAGLAVVTVLSYTAYTLAPSTIAWFQTGSLVWSVPFVVFGLFRFYVLVGDHSEAQSPTDTMVRDLPFLLNMGGWFLFITAALYFQW